MKEKDLSAKKLLVQKVGMEYDEVAPIFSEETLSTMMMVRIVGGSEDTYSGNCVTGCSTNTYCATNCISGCGAGGGVKEKKC